MGILIDSHAHLSLMKARGIDLIDFFTAWEATGGSFIVDPGVQSDDFKLRYSELKNFPLVLFACGIWPGGEAVRSPASILEHIEKLESYVKLKEVCAVGECGFDFHWNEGGSTLQEELFCAQIELAKKYNKPILIHSRDAKEKTIEVVKKYTFENSGIIHSFSYDAETALTFADSNFYLSFSGPVTYKNASNLRDAVKLLPLDRILVETDSPYLSPEPLRGKLNSPLTLPYIYSMIAQCKGISVEDLQEAVFCNFKKLFKM